jgi:4-diphosphocytidyl-2-C-methyl-D-erythritol kinase
MRLAAPAKLNLCLYLGPRRADGLHELVSLFEPLTLGDSIEVTERPAGERDEVVCPGVEGENLAARALAALREHGWDGPPLRLRIEKRIPVAAGLGGGSADAAAVLRLARGEFAVHWPGNSPDGVRPDLQEIAAGLGADVPSQLDPAMALVRGAGERVERLPAPPSHAVLLLSHGGNLRTASVFEEADRLGLGRGEPELEGLTVQLRAATAGGAPPFHYLDLLVNDLEPAAISLRPEIGATLRALRRTEARKALLTGSGPTVAGLFDDVAAARRAAAALERDDAIVCEAGGAP